MGKESILIVGHPASGKTTFIAQLYTRLGLGESKIKLLKSPENIKAIKDAVDSLAGGEEAETTSATDYAELNLNIEVNGQIIDLVCPDYGGEQVNNITALMEIDENWEKLLESNRWLLFIRPNEITHDYDLSVTSYEDILTKKSEETIMPGLSKQSKFIELLQSMLFIKGYGIKQSIKKPSLTIVLTCWDELNTKEKPIEILQEKLPLLLDFLKTIWSDDSFRVLGLSAQEFPLKEQENKDKYLDNLPENYGYMIDIDGKKDSDITKVIQLAF